MDLLKLLGGKSEAMLKERKMIPVSSNSVRKGVFAAAIALTGTAALAQQQFANLDDERRAYLSAQCDHIKDHAEASGCYAKSAIEFNRAKTEAARQATVTAKKGI